MSDLAELPSDRAIADVAAAVPPAVRPGTVAPVVLPVHLSAARLLTRAQMVAGAVALAGVPTVVALRLTMGIGPSGLWWARACVLVAGAVSLVYAAFRVHMVWSGAHMAASVRAADEVPAGPDGEVPQGPAGEVPDELLPRYTVLVPLLREGKVLPQLLAQLAKLDYPADKLEVLLLIEEDDDDTRDALAAVAAGPEGLDPRFEMVDVVPGHPQTKPRACNVGLACATGDLCVIYDAEDRPHVDQLRRAARAFRELPEWVVCLQAELHYWNPWTNWLTRCFSAEYATLYSLFLHGLARHRYVIPLGGTSNHLRIPALRQLGGWDAYNVTEDADLGIRIARWGWEVRMLPSVTEEEANSQVANWVRQRGRWVKGHLQTWLVHMRSPWRLRRELGTRRFLVWQLTLGVAVSMNLVNPVLWAVTLVTLAAASAGVHPARAVYSGWPLYLGMTSLVVGNVAMAYLQMIGCLERGLHRAVRTMFTLPLYWALTSAAAYRGLWQLVRPSRRFHWDRTEHGLVDLPGPDGSWEGDPVAGWPQAGGSRATSDRVA